MKLTGNELVHWVCAICGRDNHTKPGKGICPDCGHVRGSWVDKPMQFLGDKD